MCLSLCETCTLCFAAGVSIVVVFGSGGIVYKNHYGALLFDVSVCLRLVYYALLLLLPLLMFACVSFRSVSIGCVWGRG